MISIRLVRMLRERESEEEKEVGSSLSWMAEKERWKERPRS